MPKRHNGPVVVLLTALVTAAVLLSLDDASQRKTELEIIQTEYCEMVTIGKETNGKLGWPDYRKTFEKECVK